MSDQSTLSSVCEIMERNRSFSHGKIYVVLWNVYINLQEEGHVIAICPGIYQVRLLGRSAIKHFASNLIENN